MPVIRPFCNADLSGLFDVWIQHWKAARHQPTVSIASLERAILGRMFFRPEALLVAETDGRVVAWCHGLPNPHDQSALPADDGSPSPVWTITAFCLAGEHGLAACDDLLVAVESSLRNHGATEVRVGVVRDTRFGFAGLDPVGHGIGVPVVDARTASMLSRHGYHVHKAIDRMVAQTSTYRVPVNRDFLQLRRQTRIDRGTVLPNSLRMSVAMSHFDIERYLLMDHLSGRRLADVDVWLSDVEVHVMDGGRAILGLQSMPAHWSPPIDRDSAAQADDGDRPGVAAEAALPLELLYLIAAIVPNLASRNVYSLETAIDASGTSWLDQLKALNFHAVEQGRQWVKRWDERPTPATRS